MKTADVLFNENSEDYVMNALDFYKAHTEHDKEIVEMIDDMIKIKKAYFETSVRNKDHLRSNGFSTEISLLKEIKDKIKE